VQDMAGIRLATYIINNYGYGLYKPKNYYSRDCKKKRQSRILTDNSCVLTGYYVDEEILEPIYTFLKYPDCHTTFRLLIRKCLNNFFEACSNDMEEYQSEERFKEESQANEWEYLSDGTLFN